MNVMNFNSKQCERIRRQLDAYLSNELLVETTGEVLRHLETCEECRRELAARTRMREALRKAVATQTAPAALRQSVMRQIRDERGGAWLGFLRPQWMAPVAAAVILLAATVLLRVHEAEVRGLGIIDNVMAIGVADHVQCAIKGHNYPNVANPPEQLRKQLGPRYAGLLEIVQQKLPGFEVMEAHICSIPGSPRKYVHFITRGRGTILSVVLTRREGPALPSWLATRSDADGVKLYMAHLEGMNAAGFESSQYWGFVVSDLSRDATEQIAEALAPPLKEALDSLPALAKLAPEQDIIPGQALSGSGVI